VRKFLILLSLWFGLTASVFAAETLTLNLTDGTSVTGDIVKSDDNGMMIHTTTDAYTTIQWARFAQDALKQLVKNPKLQGYVEPFIEPTAADRPPKPEIKAPSVTRVIKSPDQLHPSLFGGLVHSSVGLFILLVIYAANLYAAFEIAVVRGKPIGVAMAVSAVLPLIGPVFFLTQPIKMPPTEEELAAEGAPAGAAPGSPQEEIQIVAASWQGSQEEKKPQPQIFSRGKFTLNKRFIETKFAGFIGEEKGDAKTFTMEVKTLKETFAVERIMQVGATEAIFETPNGQVTVPFADIQEIKLNPKTA
jgi:HAMP domain-containing protein